MERGMVGYLLKFSNLTQLIQRALLMETWLKDILGRFTKAE